MAEPSESDLAQDRAHLGGERNDPARKTRQVALRGDRSEDHVGGGEDLSRGLSETGESVVADADDDDLARGSLNVRRSSTTQKARSSRLP